MKKSDAYYGKLNCGMKVSVHYDDGALIGKGVVKSADNTYAILRLYKYGGWHVERHRHGYWSGDNSVGFLVCLENRLKNKLKKLVKTYENK